MTKSGGVHPEVAVRLATIVGALILFSAPLAVEAQQPGKVYRIGIFGERASDSEETRLWQSFRVGLRERGWIEGENLQIESRWAEGNAAQLSALASDLLRLNVDLIVTRGSRHVQPLKEATSAIPIVFLIHANPVGLGHVASLAKPGGNITGLSDFGQDTEAKRLELLKEIDPRIKRVAVLWNPDIPSHAPRLKALQEAVRALPFRLTPVAARTAAELDPAFASIAQERAQAVIVLSAPDFNAARQRVAELALRYRLSTMFGPRQHVDVGGLISYGPHLADLFRRGAIYVDKILKGAKPADLPVEQPAKFELVVNLKTAKALGLTIPQSVLLRADEVIQ